MFCEMLSRRVCPERFMFAVFTSKSISGTLLASLSRDIAFIYARTSLPVDSSEPGSLDGASRPGGPLLASLSFHI